jgi:hypothetical protein
MKELWNRLVWTRDEDHWEFWHGNPSYKMGVITLWQMGCFVASFVGAFMGFAVTCWWEDPDILAYGCMGGGLALTGAWSIWALYHWVL